LNAYFYAITLKVLSEARVMATFVSPNQNTHARSNNSSVFKTFFENQDHLCQHRQPFAYSLICLCRGKQTPGYGKI